MHLRPASLALLLVAAAAGAAAQTSTIWVNRSDHTLYAPEKSDRRGLEVLHRSARCVVERARGAAGQLILAVPESAAAARIVNGAIRNRLDQCAWAWIHINGVLLRGIIAEALYESEFPSAPAPGPWIPVEPIAWPRGHETAPQLAPAYELGRCVVAADPPAVHHLLATEPFSSDEETHLQALAPLLAPCLDAGSTIELNRETLRALLAESLYRWVAAQRGAHAASR